RGRQGARVLSLPGPTGVVGGPVRTAGLGLRVGDRRPHPDRTRRTRRPLAPWPTALPGAALPSPAVARISDVTCPRPERGPGVGLNGRGGLRWPGRAAAPAAAERRPDLGRRPRLGRPRLLRAEAGPHAEPRPA